MLPRTRFARTGLMALALATGSMLATAAIAPDAMAQRKKKEEQEQAAQGKNTPAFAKAYSAVVPMVQGEAPDWAGAAQRRGEFVNAIGNGLDRYTAGQMILKLGSELKQQDLQGEGLKLILDSGMATEKEAPLYNFYLASFAYNAKNYAEAISYLKAAQAAGYVDNDDTPANDPEFIILQSYVNLEQHNEALAYATPLIEQSEAAGTPMSEPFIRRALQTALDTDNRPAANKLSRALLSSYDSADTWRVALQVAQQLNDLDDQAELDLLRLMREANALNQRVLYTRYIESADPRIMSNEVKDVLAEGLAAGHFQTSETYYVDVNNIVKQRAAMDQREIEGTIKEGRSGSAKLALAAGDVLYSLKDYARAAEMYQIAADKGADTNVAMTRLGMAKTKAGDSAGAIAALEQVSGTRKPVAELWAIYAKRQMS